ALVVLDGRCRHILPLGIGIVVVRSAVNTKSQALITKEYEYVSVGRPAISGDAQREGGCTSRPQDLNTSPENRCRAHRHAYAPAHRLPWDARDARHRRDDRR